MSPVQNHFGVGKEGSTLDNTGNRHSVLQRTYEKFDLFFETLVKAMNLTGAIAIFGVMLLICADIIMRNVASQPIHGVPELVGQSIVMIMFLQLVSTIRHNGIPRAEIGIVFFRNRSPRIHQLLEFLIALAGGFVCLLIATETYPRLIRSIERSEVFGTEGIFAAPLWPIRLIVVVGSALAAIQFLLIAINHFRNVFNETPKKVLED